MTVLLVREVEPVTPRSVATRARLVAIAERLFAERGIEGVSLNDINKAAGQRNKNATHYHFGSKLGLLQAIIDKHEPRVSARRNQLLDEAEARGAITLRDAVRALVYPLGEKLFDPDGGPEYIRVNAQLVTAHTWGVLELHEPLLKMPQVDRLTTAMRRAASHLPEAIAQQRGILVAAMLLHGLADHTRMLEKSDRRSASTSTELLIRNLEDAIVAALEAPVPAATAALLEQLEGRRAG